MWNFIIGFSIGSIFGLMITALCVVAKRGDGHE